MTLPHVTDRVPRAYVDLGAALSTLGHELMEWGQVPLLPRSAIAAHLASCGPQLGPDCLARGLEFLANGGSLVLADGGTTAVLDPLWLAHTLAQIITTDRARLAVLPRALVERGLLAHDPATLAQVWPEGPEGREGVDGERTPGRALLLDLLHRFDLATPLVDCEGQGLGLSLVPSMLPWGDVERGQDLLQPLQAGESRAGVQYRLAMVPPDLWGLLLVRSAALSVPQVCTTSTAAYRMGCESAAAWLDEDDKCLTVWCQGPNPSLLRRGLHSIVFGLVETKFPGVMGQGAVTALCHMCGAGRRLTSEVKTRVQAGTVVGCEECLCPLQVLDLVEDPGAALERALAAVEATITEKGEGREGREGKGGEQRATIGAPSGGAAWSAAESRSVPERGHCMCSLLPTHWPCKACRFCAFPHSAFVRCALCCVCVWGGGELARPVMTVTAMRTATMWRPLAPLRLPCSSCAARQARLWTPCLGYRRDSDPACGSPSHHRGKDGRVPAPRYKQQP
jgi:hypothetical protein